MSSCRRSRRSPLRLGIAPIAVTVVLLAANMFIVPVATAATCPRVPSAGGNFAGCDYSKRKLRNLDLRRVDLSGANLARADLSGSDLTGADLQSAKLARTVLTSTDLTKTDLRKVAGEGADLTGAYLDQTDLSRANLSGAVLDGAALVDTKLLKANLAGASLRQARLDGGNLTGAKLDDAILDGAQVLGTGGAGFTDAVLGEVLGVDAGQLGRALKEHAISFSLEDTEQSLVTTLKPACAGTPVGGAGTSPGETFHPIVSVGSGQDSAVTPPALRFAEFVACVDPDVAEEVDRCAYTAITTGGGGGGGTFSIPREQHSRRVRVLDASTGAVVAEQVLTGPPPDECPIMASSIARIGERVDDDAVQRFLEPFAGDVPTVVALPPSSVLSSRLDPSSGPPGTIVSVQSDCDTLDAVLVDARNGKTVAASTQLELARSVGGPGGPVIVWVPDSARPGRYDVEATCTGPTERSGSTRFTVTRGSGAPLRVQLQPSAGSPGTRVLLRSDCGAELRAVLVDKHGAALTAAYPDTSSSGITVLEIPDTASPGTYKVAAARTGPTQQIGSAPFTVGD